MHTITDRAANVTVETDKEHGKTNTKSTNISPHLSHHAIPRSIDLLAMFAVRDQVKVIGELDRLCDLLQDVNAETLTATFYVNP